MTTKDVIKNLEKSIADAQALLNSIKSEFTPEGWLAVRVNGTPPTQHQLKFAPRHGCEWNQKERRDLLTKWLQFTSVETLAMCHYRTDGSIRSELQRLLNKADTEALISVIVGKEGDEA